MPFTYTVKASITLERAKRSKIIRSYLDQQDYVRIQQAQTDGVSFHKKYWRPEAKGYTANAAEAWITSGSNAWEHVSHCGPEKGIVFLTLRRKDERTQEEMGNPRVEFKGVAERTPTGKMRFKYNVAQNLPPPSVGRSLEFEMFLVWDCHTGKVSYEVGELDPTEDVEQLTRWHRAISWALANLPKPRLEIPIW